MTKFGKEEVETLSKTLTIKFNFDPSFQFNRAEIRALIRATHVPFEVGYLDKAYLACDACTEPTWFRGRIVRYPCPYRLAVETWEKAHPDEA